MNDGMINFNIIELQVLNVRDASAVHRSLRLTRCNATLDDPDFQELLSQMKKQVRMCYMAYPISE
jgi:hypothetical protein